MPSGDALIDNRVDTNTSDTAWIDSPNPRICLTSGEQTLLSWHAGRISTVQRRLVEEFLHVVFLLPVVPIDSAQIPGQISSIIIPSRESVTEPAPHVLGPIFHVVILQPWPLEKQHTFVYQKSLRHAVEEEDLQLIPRTWMQHNSAVDLVPFEPTSAWCVPHSTIMK